MQWSWAWNLRWLYKKIIHFFLTVSIGICLAARNFSDICQNDLFLVPGCLGWLIHSLRNRSIWKTSVWTNVGVVNSFLSSFTSYSTAPGFPFLLPSFYSVSLLLICKQSSWLWGKSSFTQEGIYSFLSFLSGLVEEHSCVLHTVLHNTNWQSGLYCFLGLLFLVPNF